MLFKNSSKSSRKFSHLGMWFFRVLPMIRPVWSITTAVFHKTWICFKKCSKTHFLKRSRVQDVRAGLLGLGTQLSCAHLPISWDNLVSWQIWPWKVGSWAPGPICQETLLLTSPCSSSLSRMGDMMTSLWRAANSARKTLEAPGWQRCKKRKN